MYDAQIGVLPRVSADQAENVPPPYPEGVKPIP